MNTEQSNTINRMTHRQLTRFAKVIGLKGDFMKPGSIEGKEMTATEFLRWRVTTTCQLASDDHVIALHLTEAFPQGIFTRHNHHQAVQNANAVQAAPLASVAPSDTATQLATLLTQMAGGNATVNPDQVREIVRKELEGIILPVTVHLKTDNGEVRKLDGLHHRRFPDLLAKVQCGVNVWLAGPAGTGKTTAAHNVAKALELPFFFNGAIDNEYKLLGFTDAQGRIVSRPFRKAYTEGGVYLFDEVDASMPGALLAFNAAMANGHCDFPDGCFQRHETFRAIAAANTYGQGANADYVGRNRMDGAFLDRFVMQQWEIDETLERAISGNDKWVTYVQDVRKRVGDKGIKVIISPRASIHGARMLASGISWEECQFSCLRRGMSDEQWAGVR